MASLADSASLIMKPVAKADGLLPSAVPADGSGDFTVTREGYGASVATRVKNTGYLETGQENYLDNSNWLIGGRNALPTGWTNFTGGDGYYDTGASQGQIEFVSPTGSDRAFLTSPSLYETGVFTASVKVDAVVAGYSVAELISRSGSASTISYLENGLVVSSSHVITAGNTYSHVFNVTGAWNARFGVGVGGSTAGQATLSEPQVEKGMVRKTYVPTGFQSFTQSTTAEQLTDTNNFDFGTSVWTNQNSDYTVTNGQTDKDGGSTAWLIDKATANNNYIRQDVDSGGVCTLSLYAKQDTLPHLLIYAQGGTGYFDLSSGTVSFTVGGAISAYMTDEGSGWYLCTLVAQNTEVFYIQPVDATNSTAAGSIFIQDASLTWKYADLASTADNLLSDPNDFDESTWTTFNATPTSGEDDRAGGTDAWLLTKSAAGASIQQAITTSGVNTISAFLKAGTLDWASVQVSDTSGAFAYFDIANGTIGTEGGAVLNSSITAAGNGFYHCSLTFSGNAGNYRIFPAQADNNVSGTSGNIIIQDARLALGDEIGKYAGLLGDMPRLNYDAANPTCPSLLLEPSRTNQLSDSVYFGDNATLNTTRTNNATTSPSGYTDATLLESNTATTAQKWLQFEGTSPTTDMVFSLYVKEDDHQYIQLLNAGDNDLYANFDLTNGVVGDVGSGATASIEDWGNGWYRCICVWDSAEAINGNDRIYLTDSLTTAYAQNSATAGVGAGVYVWGSQQEHDVTYATSLIPTYGSTVTRAVDSAATTLSSLLSTQAFTLAFNLKALSLENSGSKEILNLNINGTSDNISFFFNYASTGGLNVYLGPTNGDYVFGASANDAWNLNTLSKIALSYDGDRLAYFINGSLYDETTGVTFLDADTLLSINGNEANEFSLAYQANTALSDGECEALTTL